MENIKYNEDHESIKKCYCCKEIILKQHEIENKVIWIYNIGSRVHEECFMKKILPKLKEEDGGGKENREIFALYSI